jgi:hypothetical protein
MLLRGMHDHGCDDIYIIVTDMKRAEMDAATDYFKLVCQHTFGQPVKPSTEREIYNQREPRLPLAFLPRAVADPPAAARRREAEAHAGEPAPDAVLPADRPHIPRDPRRAPPAVPHPLLAPDDVLLADLLHAPGLCSRPGHLLRLPLGLSEPVMHRGLRDDPLPAPRRHRCCCAPAPPRPQAHAALPPRAPAGDVQLDRLRRCFCRRRRRRASRGRLQRRVGRHAWRPRPGLLQVQARQGAFPRLHPARTLMCSQNSVLLDKVPAR